MINLNSFLLITIFSLLLRKFVASESSEIGHCLQEWDYGNDVGRYINNLYTVVGKLSSGAVSLSYYNTTAGESPGKAYALSLCRGDASSDLCHTCVTSLTVFVSPSDLVSSGCRDAFAYTDNCVIRFANYSFFGISYSGDTSIDSGKSNAANFEEYNRTLEGVVLDLIVETAYNSTTLFATKKAGVGGGGDESEKVYGLAQCTPDISKGNCSGCLKEAFSNIIQKGHGGNKYAWAMLPSCQLRYDNTSFYNGSDVVTTNPLAAFLLLFSWGLFFVNWFLY